jgi:hypothetical protein
LFMTLIWMCIAYETDSRRAQMRRTNDRLQLANTLPDSREE